MSCVRARNTYLLPLASAAGPCACRSAARCAKTNYAHVLASGVKKNYPHVEVEVLLTTRRITRTLHAGAG